MEMSGACEVLHLCEVLCAAWYTCINILFVRDLLCVRLSSWPPMKPGTGGKSQSLTHLNIRIIHLHLHCSCRFLGWGVGSVGNTSGVGLWIHLFIPECSLQPVPCILTSYRTFHTAFKRQAASYCRQQQPQHCSVQHMSSKDDCKY